MDQRPFGWLGCLGLLRFWGFYTPALFALFLCFAAWRTPRRRDQ